MGTIPDVELQAVNAMQGYDQMLEVDRLCKQYGFDEASIRSMMASATGAAAHSSQPSPEIQETPSQVNNAPMNARPNLINKDQFRFEYDPSREAAERREQVKQAILCAACGVALGIPDIRPIKVTCPACMYETTYQQ
ncbi:MAG: hypothetical protein L7S56_03395 [Candidatus Poseidonia sp.]|nr:hypothetical protein [Poseidonia sp.]